MSAIGLRAFLISHTDDPKGARHHLYATLGDDGLYRLCCWECKPRQFLVRETANGEQSSSSPGHLRAADRCEEHVGQRKGFCGPCRADSLVVVPSQVLCPVDECPVHICGGPHHWVKTAAGFDAVAYADGTLVSERPGE